MKEIGILFTSDMVRALLAKRKTQTRRLVNPQPAMPNTDRCIYTVDGWQYTYLTGKSGKTSLCAGIPKPFKCRYGNEGDRLWVRENYQPLWAEGFNGDTTNWKTGVGYAPRYMATEGRIEWFDIGENEITDRVKPAIHMPRWASRILLENTDIRVERVQDITEADALAEGIQYRDQGPLMHRYGLDSWHPEDWRATAREAYLHLFYGINKRMPVTENPWVWVISFKEVTA